MTQFDEPARLEEYKALRAEILTTFTLQSARMEIAWAAVAGLLGIAGLTRVPEFGCVAIALVASAWRNNVFLTDRVNRIGAYIAVAIEPAVPGLGWERAGVDIEKDLLGHSSIQRVGRTLGSTYFMLAAACGISTVLLFTVFPPADTRRWVFAAILAGLALISCLVTIRDAIRTLERRKYWREQFRRIVPGHSQGHTSA